jgi:hypothetical protein
MAEKDPIDRTSASAEVQNDAAFAARVLAGLPDVPVPGALEVRILADFDAAAARRKSSLWNWALHPVRSLRDAVWPGAPAWQPASVFALSLLIGLAAGTLVPSSALTNAGFVQDETPAVDTVPNLDLSGDF